MADESQVQTRSFDDRVYDELKPERGRVKPERGFSIRRGLLSVGRALKQLILFLLSQFGLILVVVFYSIVGAWIFSQLERPNEEATCVRNQDLYHRAEASMADRMWEVVTAYQQPNDFLVATGEMQTLLNEFKNTVRPLTSGHRILTTGRFTEGGVDFFYRDEMSPKRDVTVLARRVVLPWSYDKTGGGITSSPGLRAAEPPAGPPWSVTDPNRRRRRQTPASKTILTH